ETWSVAGDRTLYTDPAMIDFRPKVIAAFLDAPDRIRVQLSAAVTAEDLSREQVEVTIGGASAAVDTLQPVAAGLFGAERWDIHLAAGVTPAQLPRAMTLTLPGFAPAAVEVRDALMDPDWTALEAQLGYDYAPAGTTFR